MFGERSFFFRLLAALLLISLLVAAGTLVYRAGFSQGYANGAAISSGEGGQTAPPAGPGYLYYPYYGRGFFGPRFGFFPFFPIIGFFFFGLLFFGLLRFLFWPRRWGYPGHWRGYGPPPWAGEGPQGSPGRPEGQPQTGERPDSQG